MATKATKKKKSSKKTTKKKKEETMSLDDPLAELNLTATEEPKSKKKDEKVHVTNSDLDDACKEIVEAKKMEKDAKAKKAKAEAKIIPWAEEERIRESQKKGEPISSLIVNETIRVSTQNRWSKIDPDNKQAVAEVLGKEVNDYVETVNSIALRPEFTKDKGKLQELIEAIGGPEKFKEFFTISQDLKLKPAFHSKYSTDKKFHAKVEDLVEDGILKNAKPTVVPA